MWQGALLSEMKDQKIKLVKEIRGLIAEMDTELKETLHLRRSGSYSDLRAPLLFAQSVFT